MRRNERHRYHNEFVGTNNSIRHNSTGFSPFFIKCRWKFCSIMSSTPQVCQAGIFSQEKFVEGLFYKQQKYTNWHSGMSTKPKMTNASKSEHWTRETKSLRFVTLLPVAALEKCCMRAEFTPLSTLNCKNVKNTSSVLKHKVILNMSNQSSTTYSTWRRIFLQQKKITFIP